MNHYRLDEVEQALVTLLQEDSRRPATDLAEQIGVSDNTIHDRMDRLEKAGVITGYSATIDYDEIGFDFHAIVTCTVRRSRQNGVAGEVRALPAVTEVTELMTGQRNLLVEVVATTRDGLARVVERLDELDLEIVDESLVRSGHVDQVDFTEIDEDSWTDD